MTVMNDFAPRRVLLLILLLAALLGVLTIAIGCSLGPDGHAAVPQLDSLLFHQYARAIAEGHPYRFNAADPPSTGSTSHLFPAVLALFYRAGLGGDSLATVNLVLNILFYLASLAVIFAITRRLHRAAAPLAACLCALSGQMYISFMLSSDMGLFTLLALGAYAAALYERRGWLCLALVLAVWCRPEGFILSALLAGFAVLPAGGRAAPPARRTWLLAGVTGVTAFGAMMLFNHALTGSCQFQSVQNKGAFHSRGFFGGLHETVHVLIGFVAQALFNLGYPNRVLYGFPVLAGVLGLVGLASRRWAASRTARLELWWIASSVAALLLVASSGWEGLQYDKYWAWFLPLWMVYIVIGFLQLARRVPWRGFRPLLIVLLAGYQLLSLAQFVLVYYENCVSTAFITQSVRRLTAVLPPSARLGCRSASGLTYYLEQRPLYNIDGICAPQYIADGESCQVIERLRHRPTLRFDHWLLTASDTAPWLKPMLGGQVAASTPVFGESQFVKIYRAAWDRLAETTAPLTASLIPPGARLMDACDVAYAADEKRCGYDLFNRIAGTRIQPVVATGSLGARKICDVGRVVIGTESFRLKVQPGRPARLILRGVFKIDTTVKTPDFLSQGQIFEFTSPLRLNVLVDGRSAGQWVIETKDPPENFFEKAFDLPAALLTSDHPEITIGGDHIAFDYWLYQ